MTLNGITYSFVRAGEAVSVEHMGPEGLPCRDALVYPDRVLGVIPGALVKVAREVLETRI
jgi:hypothetical protein